MKQGSHSVGVQRQYTGSAGKITNCQLGVSLSITTRTEQLPIDFELYLPRSWMDNPERRAEGRIPEDLLFKTKPELALDMMRRARADGVPKGVVLADTSYGNSDFRKGVGALKMHYAVGVEPQTNVTLVDRDSRPRGEPISVRDLSFTIRDRGGFRRCTWRKGTKQDLTARFALRCVVTSPDGPDPQWLLIEWRDGEPEPANYSLSTLPERLTKRQLIRIVMQRWRRSASMKT
jgi:SRSO17 transposase